MNEVIKEVEIGIEEAIVTETNRVKEIESNESIRQNIQHQRKADSIVKEIERVRVPETMEDIQIIRIAQRSIYKRMKQKKDQNSQLK